eukprot:CAMPEP_0195302848 /NCGR_PEP_ID=MMETSP0707-20130614/31794_1 /TAXON_ID=33640 /ORGANISM="Asterionellopsis glacialis, Strain CCMP134" /LENGTH=216 /DNA_ID=CAMNT_0040366209 /DNA_START=159 /DNA_END=809 /DNA_ORIENTATION=-
MAYRNHCFRVMTFARHFLPNELMQQEERGQKSGAVIMNTLGMAIAYHKVGLWMDSDYVSDENNATSSDQDDEKEEQPQPVRILAPTGFDYRNSSIRTMEHYTRKVGILGDREIQFARIMIEEQFRLTEYGDPQNLHSGRETEILNALVNAIRKANWADCTYGIIRFGLPVPLLEAAYAKLDPLGFHKILANRILQSCQKNLIKAPLELLGIMFGDV